MINSEEYVGVLNTPDEIRLYSPELCIQKLFVQPPTLPWLDLEVKHEPCNHLIIDQS